MATESDLFDEVSAPPFDFKQVFLYGIGRSLWWIVVLTVITTMIGVWTAASQPNSYTSEAKLILRLGNREAVMVEEALVDSGSVLSRPTMEDEIHLLNDTAIYYDAAQHLGANVVLEPADPRRYDSDSTPAPLRWMHSLQWSLVKGGGGTGEHAPLDVAARALQLSTIVYNESRSNIITVHHTATSPEKAHDQLEVIVAGFIHRHRDHFSILPHLDKHRSKVEMQQNSRDAAKKALSDHISRCGFIDLEVQMPALLADLELLDADHFAAKVAREGVANQIAKLQVRLEKLNPEIETVIPAVMGPNPDYQAKIALRGTYEVQRDSLKLEGGALQERERRHNELSGFIRDLDAELAKLEPKVVITPARREYTPNPEWTRLDNLLLEARLTDENLGKKMEQLEARLREKRDEFDRIQDCQVAHDELNSIIAQEANRYDFLFNRFSALEALGSIDLNEESDNLSVLHPPSFTEVKDGPNRKKILIVWAGVGMILGLGLALGREVLDPHLRHPEAVERVLGVRLLGVVPEAGSFGELEYGHPAVKA